jgi:hypothetical protein
MGGEGNHPQRTANKSSRRGAQFLGMAPKSEVFTVLMRSAFANKVRCVCRAKASFLLRHRSKSCFSCVSVYHRVFRNRGVNLGRPIAAPPTGTPHSSEASLSPRVVSYSGRHAVASYGSRLRAGAAPRGGPSSLLGAGFLPDTRRSEVCRPSTAAVSSSSSLAAGQLSRPWSSRGDELLSVGRGSLHGREAWPPQ